MPENYGARRRNFLFAELIHLWEPRLSFNSTSIKKLPVMTNQPVPISQGKTGSKLGWRNPSCCLDFDKSATMSTGWHTVVGGRLIAVGQKKTAAWTRRLVSFLQSTLGPRFLRPFHRQEPDVLGGVIITSNGGFGSKSSIKLPARVSNPEIRTGRICACFVYRRHQKELNDGGLSRA